MTIDYLGHSGFLVETRHVLMLFDYYRGKLDILKEKDPEKPLFVFASHVHGDHFNPEIFSIRKTRTRVRYLLSFDIRHHPSIPKDADTLYLDPDRSYAVPDLGTVETLLSTDEGVAFYVRTADLTLFHAGDLNWWDWEGEDPAWLKEQETVYKREIQKLAGKPIDLAFLVLDDRLEKNSEKGMHAFLSVCSPKHVFPMHFWEDGSVIQRYLDHFPADDPRGRIFDTANQSHWEIQSPGGIVCNLK